MLKLIPALVLGLLTQDKGVAVSRFGLLYDLDFNSRAAEVKFIIPDKFSDITVSPVGDIYLISDDTSKTVYKISIDYNDVWSAIVVGNAETDIDGDLGGVAYNPIDGKIYFTLKQFYGSVSKLYYFDDELNKGILIGDTNAYNIVGMDFDIEGNLIGYDRGLSFPFPGITKINIETGASITLTEPGEMPWFIPLSLYYQGTHLYIADDVPAEVINYSEFVDTGVYFGFDNFFIFGMDSILKEIGTAYCYALPNSTGSIAKTRAFGSKVISDQTLQITCENLPENSIARLIISEAVGFIPYPGGALGHMCVYGSVIRKELLEANTDGVVSTVLNPTIPISLDPLLSIMIGETIYFQYTYTDNGLTHYAEPTFIIFE